MLACRTHFAYAKRRNAIELIQNASTQITDKKVTASERRRNYWSGLFSLRGVAASGRILG